MFPAAQVGTRGRDAERRFGSAAPLLPEPAAAPQARADRSHEMYTWPTRSVSPAPYPCHRRCAPADPLTTGQSASRPGSPQPLRRASARGKARSAAAAGSVPAAPRHPGPSIPCRAGSGWRPGAALARSWGEKHYLSPFCIFFRFIFFSFVLFRFVSFRFVFSAGNERELLHGASTPPYRRVTHQANLPSPIRTTSRPAPGLRRAPAEHPPSTPMRHGGAAATPRRRPAPPEPLEGFSAAGACGAGAPKEARGGPERDISL